LPHKLPLSTSSALPPLLPSLDTLRSSLTLALHYPLLVHVSLLFAFTCETLCTIYLCFFLCHFGMLCISVLLI
jgi:hypothetical protein